MGCEQVDGDGPAGLVGVPVSAFFMFPQRVELGFSAQIDDFLSFFVSWLARAVCDGDCSDER